EYAQYAGNYYGTDINVINENLSNGKKLILEIDVQGALQIKKKYKDAILIFILPPNLDELKKRLIGRNTENEEIINLRMSQVERELERAKEFNYEIINDDLHVAINSILNIIKE
ncbi:MAG: hypothetical protein MJ180_03860, partial [Candidatus Gastranaerophilales bacterium]|nr:hypothetical protein [Candidatus Gastranaerophilales bacterium]